MELIFRKIDENDCRDIEMFNGLMDQLSQSSFDPQRLKANIAQVNQREDAYLMAAQDPLSGQLCGSLLAFICPDFCGPCTPFMLIENVVTHSDYRRRGVGKAMFEEIERWGREREVRYAILCSSNSRTHAHEFYPAIGYGDVKGFKKFL